MVMGAHVKRDESSSKLSPVPPRPFPIAPSLCPIIYLRPIHGHDRPLSPRFPLNPHMSLSSTVSPSVGGSIHPFITHHHRMHRKRVRGWGCKHTTLQLRLRLVWVYCPTPTPSVKRPSGRGRAREWGTVPLDVAASRSRGPNSNTPNCLFYAHPHTYTYTTLSFNRTFHVPPITPLCTPMAATLAEQPQSEQPQTKPDPVPQTPLTPLTPPPLGQQQPQISTIAAAAAAAQSGSHVPSSPPSRRFFIFPP